MANRVQLVAWLGICSHFACAADPKRVPLGGSDGDGRSAATPVSPDAAHLPTLSAVRMGDEGDAGCATDASALWMDETIATDGGASAPYGFGICSGPRELSCPLVTPVQASEWTTLPDSKRCCPFSRSNVPPFSKFPSQAKCEAWVQKRHCRPGWAGFDGCHWFSCSSDGRQVTRTLRSCEVAILLWVNFAPQSIEISHKARCDVRAAVRQFLETAQEKRKVMIKGFVYPGEPLRERQSLALERARAVMRLLADSGVPDESMVAHASDEIPRGIEPRNPVVTFDIVPNQLPLEQPQGPPPPCSELPDGGN